MGGLWAGLFQEPVTYIAVYKTNVEYRIYIVFLKFNTSSCALHIIRVIHHLHGFKISLISIPIPSSESFLHLHSFQNSNMIILRYKKKKKTKNTHVCISSQQMAVLF